MNEACSNCKFSKPLTHDKEYLLKRRELAETNMAQYEAEDEKARKSWFSGPFYFSRNPQWEYWRKVYAETQSKLKQIESDVMCHRFPATAQKRKTDVCGEWKV